MNELALFAGVGGGILASKWLLGHRIVCYVEWDKYAVEVLKARIKEGYLDDAPIWSDAFTFDGRPWAGRVDILSAGFPCQPFSNAGKGLAENDPRNGWPAVIRILREVRPRLALLENVPGLLSKQYFGTILGQLDEAGFDAEWGCLSAEAVGANHKRERLWIVAYAEGGESREPTKRKGREDFERGSEEVAAVSYSDLRAKHMAEQSREEGDDVDGDGITRQMADADGERRKKFVASRVAGDAGQSDRGIDAVSNPAGDELGKHGKQGTAAKSGGERGDHGGREAEDVGGEWWSVEPNVGRVADGVAARVDRLRAIGNGQVSRVAAIAYRLLMERIGNE